MLDTNDYTLQRLIHAPRELVFQLLKTLNGWSNWLKNPLQGMILDKGEIRFSLNGSEEVSKMRVDISDAPSTLQWSVIKDTGYDGAWAGTIIIFELVYINPGACVLHFRHIGLTPDLEVYEHSKTGWEHFITHLIATCEAAYQH